LMSRKWWDYRIVTPDVATMMFIAEYARQFREYLEYLGESRHVNILKGFDIEAPHQWHNWVMSSNTRRWCDERMIRYGDYWKYAIETHERKRRCKALYSIMCSSKMKDEVEWRISQMEEVPFAEHPVFKAENYSGCALQVCYFKYLMARIRKKYGDNELITIRRLVDNGVIPVKFFTLSHR